MHWCWTRSLLPWMCARKQEKGVKRRRGLSFEGDLWCPALDVPLHMGEGVEEAVDSEEMGLAVLRHTWLELDCVPSWERKKKGENSASAGTVPLLNLLCNLTPGWQPA